MKKIIFVISLIFLLGLIFPGSKVLATVDITSGFISERKSVYITIGHEDARPLPVLLAELEQNIDALDHVFNQLHQEGKLNEKHSILSIGAHFYSRIDSPWDHIPSTPTVLSMEQNCSVDWDIHDIRTDEVLNLGPCYSIFSTVWPITYDNLLTSILLLPKLTPENPRIEIENLETFEQYKQEVVEQKERFKHITFEKDLSWSPNGLFLLRSVWKNQKLNYQIFNFETKEKINLDILDYYLASPAWSFNSRFVVYGSQEEIKIFDLTNNRTTTIDLTQLFPEYPELEFTPKFYGNIITMTFAIDPTGNKILFDLFGILFGMVYIVWDSETGLLGPPEAYDYEKYKDWIRPPIERNWDFKAMIKGELPEELKRLEFYRPRILERYGSLYGGEISPLKDKIAFTTSEDNLLRIKVVEIDNFREINIDQFTTVDQFTPVTINEAPKVPADEVKADEKTNWLLILLTAVSIITAILIGLLIYKKRSKKLVRL